MKTILNAMAATFAAIALTACALLAPMGADDEARRAAKVTLAAYETTQQAILIYGGLPVCDETGVLRICRDRAIWQKIKIVEHAATAAINEAAPVLNGTKADAGELVRALAAIAAVKAVVIEAQQKLKGPPPAPPGST